MVGFTELATDQIGDNGIHRTLRQLIQVYGRLYGTEPYESIKQLRAELQLSLIHISEPTRPY